MAQKRKKTRRKNNGIVLSEHVIGAIYILFAVLGFLGMGYLGVLLSNVLRLFVGDTYKVAFILMIIFGCCLLLTGKTPKLNKKRICGLFICWSGVLVMFSALMFARLDLHARFVSITWQYLSADLMSSTLGTTVGGGLVGSFLYTLTYFLTAQLGSYLAADVLCFFGLCMILNLSAQDLIDAFGQMCYVVVCWLKNAAAWLFRKIKEILSQIFAEKGRLHKKSSDVLKKYVQTEESRSEEIFDQDKSDDVTEIIEKEKDESLSDSKNEEDLEFSEETFDDSDYKFPSLDLLTDGKDTDQSSE
ncbi:cell division protein FtsK, partial [Ligilactobacillus ruminis]